jgi:hypothetical protein
VSSPLKTKQRSARRSSNQPSRVKDHLFYLCLCLSRIINDFFPFCDARPQTIKLSSRPQEVSFSEAVFPSFPLRLIYVFFIFLSFSKDCTKIYFSKLRWPHSSPTLSGKTFDRAQFMLRTSLHVVYTFFFGFQNLKTIFNFELWEKMKNLIQTTARCSSQVHHILYLVFYSF